MWPPAGPGKVSHFAQICGSEPRTVVKALRCLLVHPIRTLLYGIFVEPIFDLWLHLQVAFQRWRW
jgi:hypothetical protein